MAKVPMDRVATCEGVTLVELLVVLAIIAVLSFTGYASYRATEGARVKAAAEQIASTMRRVVQAAWSERTAYRIWLRHREGLELRVDRWSGAGWVDVTSSFFPGFQSTGTILGGWSGGWFLPGGTRVVSTTYPGDYFVVTPQAITGTVELSVSTTAGYAVVMGAGGAQLRVISGGAGDITVAP